MRFGGQRGPTDDRGRDTSVEDCFPPDGTCATCSAKGWSAEQLAIRHSILSSRDRFLKDAQSLPELRAGSRPGPFSWCARHPCRLAALSLFLVLELRRQSAGKQVACQFVRTLLRYKSDSSFIARLFG